MGLMVNGQWTDRWYDTDTTNGQFIRADSQFRRQITADGLTGFKADTGRYHLFVSYACPWAHRTLIVRALKGLDHAIGVTVVKPVMLKRGWEMPEGYDGGDGLPKAFYLHHVYAHTQTDYSGRVTVPVLWDKQRECIVNNESAEIVRMFNSEFNALADNPQLNLYPPHLAKEIDRLNAEIYEQVNNGVYRAGFATRQEAYEAACSALFLALESLEEQLSENRYLLGDRITEADWRLFTTLLRFDSVYYSHFKCNLRRLAEFPNLWAYTRELYQWPGVADTVRFDHIKQHYFRSHPTINPNGIVPLGPELDFGEPHGRDETLPISPM